VTNNIGIKSGLIKSKSEPLVEISQSNFKGFKENDFFIAFLYGKVVFDYFKNLKFDNIKSSLLKLRIFNENQELLIWKEDNKFKSRLRIDNEGNGIDYTDIEQVVYGTKIKSQNGDFILWEDRGTEVNLPFNVPGIEDKKKNKRLRILVRNYIEYLNGCQASYFDNRFVKFIFPDNLKNGG
jgi:CRISPR-associated protein (TIGR03984 family)